MINLFADETAGFALLASLNSLQANNLNLFNCSMGVFSIDVSNKILINDSNFTLIQVNPHDNIESSALILSS